LKRVDGKESGGKNSSEESEKELKKWGAGK